MEQTGQILQFAIWNSSGMELWSSGEERSSDWCWSWWQLDFTAKHRTGQERLVCAAQLHLSEGCQQCAQITCAIAHIESYRIGDVGCSVLQIRSDQYQIRGVSVTRVLSSRAVRWEQTNRLDSTRLESITAQCTMHNAMHALPRHWALHWAIGSIRFGSILDRIAMRSSDASGRAAVR